MHTVIQLFQNNGRAGARLVSENASIETCWSAGRSTSAPTAIGEALRLLAQEVDGMAHGDYKRLAGALPAQTERTKTGGAAD